MKSYLCYIICFYLLHEVVQGCWCSRWALCQDTNVCLFVCPQMINPNNLQKISFCESESWWAFKWLFFGLGFSLFYTDWHDLSLSLFCTISCSKQNWYIKQILSVLLLGGAIVKTILLSDLDILPSRAVNIPEANNDQKLGSYDLDFHLWSDEK